MIIKTIGSSSTRVLFFAKEPNQRLFHVNVVCALFKGTGKAYILDRKELTSNLLENVEKALREAIVNAVCHRDYLEQCAQVMVEVFDDSVENYNPGGLPKGLNEKNFGCRSVCRNPRIAGLLLRCNYFESSRKSSGFLKFFRAK